MNTPRTLFEKVWTDHVVDTGVGSSQRPSVLYVDLHLLHEVTSPQAFQALADRGLAVRRPERTFATMDHSTPTLPGGLAILDDDGRAQLATLTRNCAAQGIRLAATGDAENGIVHVIGPELGLTQPGLTIVCGDSHTATHGAFGALAFGIGTSEVAHVLATQCLLQRAPKTLEVRLDGHLAHGVTAKDVILAVIAQIGVAGGNGHAIEYTGSAVRAMSMEQRMTICNMSIEAGARAGMVAPDDTTFEYVADRDYAPKGHAWDDAVHRWRKLTTDAAAAYDRSVTIDTTRLQPMVTFGTNPAMGVSIGDAVPRPADAATAEEQAALTKSLDYMGIEAGRSLVGRSVDVVFIGSCTNSRLSDLREAASVFDGRRVADGVRALVVPGSQRIKRAAEEEGLDRVFTNAGAQWREPGCSMCIAMNGDRLEPGQLAVSTSNRNFEGRQGPSGRTVLASPLTAAAAAVTGCITDVRTLMRGP